MKEMGYHKIKIEDYLKDMKRNYVIPLKKFGIHTADDLVQLFLFRSCVVLDVGQLGVNGRKNLFEYIKSKGDIDIDWRDIEDIDSIWNNFLRTPMSSYVASMRGWLFGGTLQDDPRIVNQLHNQHLINLAIDEYPHCITYLHTRNINLKVLSHIWKNHPTYLRHVEDSLEYFAERSYPLDISNWDGHFPYINDDEADIIRKEYLHYFYTPVSV